MSAEVELLRRVAVLMREDTDRRWWVVADWLDAEYAHFAPLWTGPQLARAIGVARTYLGEVRDD